MRHQLLCSGSQWGHLGDQEIGRDGQEETGGRWWYSFLSSPNSHSTSPQGPHSERQRDDPCCYFVSPWPEEPESLQTFSFLLPSLLLPLSGMSCPIFPPLKVYLENIFKSSLLSPGIQQVSITSTSISMNFTLNTVRLCSAAFQVTFTDRQTDGVNGPASVSCFNKLQSAQDQIPSVYWSVYWSQSSKSDWLKH